MLELIKAIHYFYDFSLIPYPLSLLFTINPVFIIDKDMVDAARKKIASLQSYFYQELLLLGTTTKRKKKRNRRKSEKERKINHDSARVTGHKNSPKGGKAII